MLPCGSQEIHGEWLSSPATKGWCSSKSRTTARGTMGTAMLEGPTQQRGLVGGAIAADRWPPPSSSDLHTTRLQGDTT